MLDGGKQCVCETFVESWKVDRVCSAVVDVVYANPERDQSLGLFELADFLREDWVAVLLELVDLVYQGDGEVVMEGCASIVSTNASEGLELIYYSVEMSAPANAKSQSCFLQLWGEVRPSSVPHPVRYSTQLGPPSAVPVWGLC